MKKALPKDGDADAAEQRPGSVAFYQGTGVAKEFLIKGLESGLNAGTRAGECQGEE